MAATIVDNNDETEDLTHCGICFLTFDDNIHKPKFLLCHHTFCLHCIKGLGRIKEASLPCPKCSMVTLCAVGQESVLANNPYALQILANMNMTSSLTRLPIKDQWCLFCKKEATGQCIVLANHKTLSMESKPTEFCIDLQKSMDINEAQLDFIMIRRKEAKTYYQQVSQILKLATDGLKKLDEENDRHLAQMTSLKEDAASISKDETLTSLSKRAGEFAEMLKQELVEVKELEKSCLANPNETNLCFQCNHEGRTTTLVSTPVEQESSHNDKQKDQRRLLKAVRLLNPVAPTTSQVALSQPQNISRADRLSTHVDENFVFAMTFSKSDREIGTVLIQRDPIFYRNGDVFARLLSSSTLPFFGKSEIDTNSPHHYVAIKGIVPLLQWAFSNRNSFLSLATNKESGVPLEVKCVDFYDYSFHGNNEDVAGFHLVFLLKYWSKTNRSRRWGRCVDFGHIIEGQNVIDTMSKVSAIERRSFTVSIVYRQL